MTPCRAQSIVKLNLGLLGDVSRTSLTERRKQFLQELVELYHRTRIPVHYETLARALGVSKWTAYDMLKELEKLGYLTRDYAVNRGDPGRSLIVFAPTVQAEALFARSRTAVTSPEEWAATKAKVLRLLKQLKGMGPGEAVQKVLQEVPKVEVRVAFCAYLLGLLLIYLRTLGETTTNLVRRLVGSAPGMEMRLTMFVGAVVGTVIQTVGHGLSSELADLVGRFLRYASDLAPQEREMLSGFLDQALTEAV